MSLLRTFIALDISQDVRDAIYRATAQLRRESGPLVRWVSSENMHLTLKFLGDVSTDQVQQLAQALEIETGRYPPFEMSFGELDAFPNVRRSRVIVLKITAPATLAALAATVEVVCVRLGHDPESREFHPHLTLGRVCQGLSRLDQERIGRALETLAIDSPGSTRVDSVQIYQSSLKSNGAVYTKLFSAQFRP